MTPAEVLALALERAGRGWPVFPVALGLDGERITKRPLTPHAHLDASTDSAELERMVNAGARRLRDGEVLGLGQYPGGRGAVVLDVDRKPDDGAATLTALEVEHKPLPPHPVVDTPSGGRHHYLGRPEGVRLGNGHRLGPGIDVRGDDGWTVCPGVSTPWGRWAIAPGTSGTPIPAAPGWVLDRIAQSGGAGPRGRWEPLTEPEHLDTATAAAVAALEALGGHSAYLVGEHEVRLCRPGKGSGSSVTVGNIGPGVAKFFTSGWTIPGTSLTFPADAVYDTDVLQSIAEAVAAGDLDRAGRLVVEREDFVRLIGRDNGAGSVTSTPSGSAVRLTAASTIRMDQPRWAWDRRIPLGGTTLMAGREGFGKTALVCHLAARLSHGELPGEYHGQPADTVYIGHEDDRATVLVPRLAAAGCDLTRFHFVDIDASRVFTVAGDVPALTETLRDRPIGLVVLDPLDAQLGVSVDTYKKAEVQAAIGHLALMAQILRCGALGLGHLNKSELSDLLRAIAGSVGFTTACRSVLGVGENPDNPAERLLVLAKANMTDRTSVPAIRFRVAGTTVSHPEHPLGINTGKVEVLGEALGVHPDSLLAGGSAEERDKLDAAVDWLRDVLDNGPMLRAEIMKYGKANGHRERTLERAGQRLNIESVRDESERGKPATWRLPGLSANEFGGKYLADNRQRSDQDKQPESEDYPPTSGMAGNKPLPLEIPASGGTLVALPCTVCGAIGRSRITGRCPKHPLEVAPDPRLPRGDQ
jgi:hypothetical protein